MIYAIDVTCVVVLLILGYIELVKYLTNKKISEIGKDLRAFSKNRVIYLVFMLLAGASLIISFNTMYHIDAITQAKLITLVMMIGPMAAVDYRLQKIPNRFLVIALLARVIILIFEILDDFAESLSIMKDSALAALVIGLFFFILLLVFKNSIGMGDIKLFAVIGLYQGIWGTVNSVFFSLLVSFFIAIFLLITKKKKRSDTIPFGPCILLGTIIAMCLSGM